MFSCLSFYSCCNSLLGEIPALNIVLCIFKAPLGGFSHVNSISQKPGTPGYSTNEIIIILSYS